MKLFETTHIFSSDWHSATMAAFRKYPNDKTPHVKHVEILNRTIDPVTGNLITERLISVSQNVPTLIKKILGHSGSSLAIEYSEVDLNNNEMRISGLNLTLNNLMTVTERITYRPTNDNNQTEFVQTAELSAKGLISRFSSYVEEYSFKVFRDNAVIGRLGFEQVLNLILQERASKVSL
jgi:hypothetical protein